MVQYRKGELTKKELWRETIDLMTRLLEEKHVDTLLECYRNYFKENIQTMVSCELKDIIKNGTALFRSLKNHPTILSDIDDHQQSQPEICFENSFLRYVIEVFLEGIQLQTPDQYATQFRGIFLYDTSRLPELSDCISHALFFHFSCLIEEVYTLPMETMRWILSAKFPAIEKDLYRFYDKPKEHAATSDSQKQQKMFADPLLFKGPGTSSPFFHEKKSSIFSNQFSNCYKPRFSRRDLTLLILASYKCPAISTPLGLHLHSKLLDNKSSFSKSKFRTHGKNVSHIGVMPWFKNTLDEGSILHTYPIQKNPCVDELFETIASDYADRLLTRRFLAFFNRKTGGTSNQEILSAIAMYTQEIDVLKSNKAQKNYDPTQSMPTTTTTESPTIRSQRIHLQSSGVNTPLRAEFLLGNDPLISKGKRKAHLDYDSPPSDFVYTINGFSRPSDDPYKVLFYQSIVCCAMLDGSIAQKPRTNLETEKTVKRFKNHFEAVLRGEEKGSGPIQQLLIGSIVKQETHQTSKHFPTPNTDTTASPPKRESHILFSHIASPLPNTTQKQFSQQLHSTPPTHISYPKNPFEPPRAKRFKATQSSHSSILEVD